MRPIQLAGRISSRKRTALQGQFRILSLARVPTDHPRVLIHPFETPLSTPISIPALFALSPTNFPADNANAIETYILCQYSFQKPPKDSKLLRHIFRYPLRHPRIFFPFSDPIFNIGSVRLIHSIKGTRKDLSTRKSYSSPNCAPHKCHRTTTGVLMLKWNRKTHHLLTIDAEIFCMCGAKPIRSLNALLREQKGVGSCICR